MTPAEKLVHDTTHLPFHPSCPYCVMARRPDCQHRKSHDGERTVPLFAADDVCVRNSADAILPTVPVIRVYPYRCRFATIGNPHRT